MLPNPHAMGTEAHRCGRGHRGQPWQKAWASATSQHWDTRAIPTAPLGVSTRDGLATTTGLKLQL